MTCLRPAGACFICQFIRDEAFSTVISERRRLMTTLQDCLVAFLKLSSIVNLPLPLIFLTSQYSLVLITWMSGVWIELHSTNRTSLWNLSVKILAINISYLSGNGLTLVGTITSNIFLLSLFILSLYHTHRNPATVIRKQNTMPRKGYHNKSTHKERRTRPSIRLPGQQKICTLKIQK